MNQHWGKLLFMHWPVPADLLRPLIPEPLAVDTYDGLAWIGVTPFAMWGVRPAFTPPLPLLSESHGVIPLRLGQQDAHVEGGDQPERRPRVSQEGLRLF